MANFGPFSVAPEQISGLGGANFAQFVVRLLQTEASAHAMNGALLETTYQENAADGGVDAELRHASATKWIPAGESAWQFKAADLRPAACASELNGATRAIEVLRAHGKYRLVLGTTLTPQKIAKRREALVRAAQELGIALADDSIEVLNADNLAEWVENYPGLAVNSVLRGTGAIGQSFEEWARSHQHQTTWVASPIRDAQIQDVREVITGSGQLDVHITGVSGLGKTRLVMEAVRGQQFEPLVVYAPSADQFEVVNLIQLQSQGRTSVVVIDECDGKQHELYAGILQTGANIRLVTIGEPGGRATRSPMIDLAPLAGDAMAELLRQNQPQLWPEAERVVVEVAAGNVDYALKAARAVVAQRLSSAGVLIRESDIKDFITANLPEGSLFLACCALALFSRIGHDADVASELSLIAAGLDINENDLRAAASSLQAQGLLSKQGRFRSVAPHPLAVYLASRAWDALGDVVIGRLLPMLNADLAERLFRRAADIGEFAATSPAVTKLLAGDGPLRSFDSMVSAENAGLLVHFAVMSPVAVANRMEQLLQATSEDELRAASWARRDLVWALEKIAWHSRTFESAATSLLKLSVAEIENYSNNATGTWVELFGALLPGTAASPEVRIAYLREVAQSPDERDRRLAVAAAGRALSPQESIMVSGELQGGVVVEPRGRPATWGEVWNYKNAAIDVLAALANDSVPDVAAAAGKQLAEAIHGFLETPVIRDHLAKSSAMLPASVVRDMRTQVASLHALFERVDIDDDRPAGLEQFESQLPPESAADRLWTVASLQPWDREEADLVAELVAAATALNTSDPAGALRDLLVGTGVPAAYAIGKAIVSVSNNPASASERLLPLVDGPNIPAVVGFLAARVAAGDDGAFDAFVDDHEFSALVKLQLTVSGTRTVRAVERVKELDALVGPADSARLLFGWIRDDDPAAFGDRVSGWLDRVESQADYNAAIDVAVFYLHNKPASIAELDPVLERLVWKRSDFPAVGQQAWDWVQLARRQVGRDPVVLVTAMAELIQARAIDVFAGSQESALLRDAVRLGGESAWLVLAERVLTKRSWLLEHALNGWFANVVPLDVVKRWVGSDVERARVLVSVVSPRGSVVPEVVVYLLDEFGGDDRVDSGLVGGFISGSWSGKTSDHIAGQIAELERWVSAAGQSAALKRWARKLLLSLEARRQEAVRREEEGEW